MAAPRVSRWEKERAAWLLAHSKPGTSMRRRAELLARTARRSSRGSLGVEESAFHDDPTSPLLMRLMKTDEGTGEKLARLILVPVVFMAVGVTIAPALALAAAAYYVLWTRSPKIGRLWWWPWITAGAAVGILGAAIWAMAGAPAPLGATPWPPTLQVYTQPFTWFFVWSQLAMGLLLTGAQIYLAGWNGVPAGAARKPETDKNGNFLETPEHKKVQLDPLANQSVAPAAAPVASDEAVMPAKEYDEAPVFADYPTFDDEAPVFADDINDLKEK